MPLVADRNWHQKHPPPAARPRMDSGRYIRHCRRNGGAALCSFNSTREDANCRPPRAARAFSVGAAARFFYKTRMIL
jgi:hypothetical protein